jgi:UDP-N-acetylglucosamine acyltransferase
MKIHPTAIVDPAAELAEGVEVQPYTVIGPQVTIGADTVIGPHCVIEGRTVIGERNRFSSSASIGVVSQDLKHNFDYTGRTVIGDDNHFREYVTVNASTVANEEDLDKVTEIGNGSLFMVSSHVGHESRVGNNIVMANCVALGGHVTLEDNVVLGGLSAVHQFCVVGTLAMVGGGTMVRKDVPPYFIVEGNPNGCYGPNTIGLQRNGLSKDAQRVIRSVYKLLYRSALNTSQALESIEADIPDTPERRRIVEFVRNSERGITRRPKV